MSVDKEGTGPPPTSAGRSPLRRGAPVPKCASPSAIRDCKRAVTTTPEKKKAEEQGSLLTRAKQKTHQ